VLFSGDEFHSWYHNEEGYVIIKDPNTGFFYWAVVVDDELVSTGIPIHETSHESLRTSIGLTPHQNISHERYLELRRPIDEMNNSKPVSAPPTGLVNNITIFIRFADQDEFEGTVKHYESLFNARYPGAHSIYRYFYDASFNQLEVVTHLFPTQTQNTILSFQSEHPRGYFMPWSVTNPYGFTGDWAGRAQRLTRDAVLYIKDQIPECLVIDADGDGFIDNINLMVRGAATVGSLPLWPHAWVLFHYEIYVHGKRVWRYNLNLEVCPRGADGLGIIAHEFAHSLGIPDFYTTATGPDPIGRWCLMGMDANPPQSINAFAKYSFVGWIDIPWVEESGFQTLYPLATHPTNTAIRIASPVSTTQYFVVE
jgi:M6 family metalloprotease-like protein